MFTNLVSLISKSLYKSPVSNVRAVTEKSANPFGRGSGNIFLASNNSLDYAKNQPIAGGYFAGYYNDKPNIVGRRLFIEV